MTGSGGGENIDNLALNEERQVRSLQETIVNQFYKKKIT